jgi:uncharacterized membrane protein YfcA
MNIAALLAGLFSGVIASMGMGGGAVLLIYLNLFTSTEQLTAQGINLLFFIPTAVFALIVYIKNKQIKFREILPVASLGLIGALLGLYLTTVINAALLTKIFGGFLCVLSAKEILWKDKNNS